MVSLALWAGGGVALGNRCVYTHIYIYMIPCLLYFKDDRENITDVNNFQVAVHPGAEGE